MNISHDIEGTEQYFVYDLDPKVKVKGQIMYLLVNVSPPKPLNVSTSNVADT